MAAPPLEPTAPPPVPSFPAVANGAGTSASGEHAFAHRGRGVGARYVDPLFSSQQAAAAASSFLPSMPSAMPAGGVSGPGSGAGAAAAQRAPPAQGGFFVPAQQLAQQPGGFAANAGNAEPAAAVPSSAWPPPQHAAPAAPAAAVGATGAWGPAAPNGPAYSAANGPAAAPPPPLRHQSSQDFASASAAPAAEPMVYAPEQVGYDSALSMAQGAQSQGSFGEAAGYPPPQPDNGYGGMAGAPPAAPWAALPHPGALSARPAGAAGAELASTPSFDAGWGQEELKEVQL